MAKFDLKMKTELVATRFNDYLQELWALDPKLEFADIVRAEATSVMLAAMSRTKAASEKKIKESGKSREWVTFEGKRYRVGERDGDGWRLRDDVWARLNTYRDLRVAMKLNARGLSKQSFANLAKSIGGRLGSIPGYVSAANYKGLQYPQDVRSLSESTPAGYLLTTWNESPIVGFAGGAWALLGAMQGRVSYFRRNMKNRRFQSIDSRARAYPGIWVSQSA